MVTQRSTKEQPDPTEHSAIKQQRQNRPPKKKRKKKSLQEQESPSACIAKSDKCADCFESKLWNLIWTSNLAKLLGWHTASCIAWIIREVGVLGAELSI